MRAEKPVPVPQSQIDWGNYRVWQIWDPAPWEFLDKERIREVMVAQLEFRANQIEAELNHVRKLQKIIGR